jgi:hypothetical protein
MTRISHLSIAALIREINLATIAMVLAVGVPAVAQSADPSQDEPIKGRRHRLAYQHRGL